MELSTVNCLYTAVVDWQLVKVTRSQINRVGSVRSQNTDMECLLDEVGCCVWLYQGKPDSRPRVVNVFGEGHEARP